MANAIRIQSQARRDVVELAVYIGQDSVGAANRFLDATDKTFAMLAQQPFLGTEHAAQNPRLNGIRVFRVKKFPNHLAFYFARKRRNRDRACASRCSGSGRGPRRLIAPPNGVLAGTVSASGDNLPRLPLSNVHSIAAAE